MKKLIAKRKLQRTCIHCGIGFNKGDVYYKYRKVEVDSYDDSIHAYEYLECSKCKYTQEHRSKRFEEMKKNCEHPEKFHVTRYRYIPGECVKEPDYDFCSLCGEII